MLETLWIIPVLPLISFLLLAMFGGRLGKRISAFLGYGSVGLSALWTIVLGLEFIRNTPEEGVHIQKIWTWLDVGGFQPDIGLMLDPLSLMFIFIITFVGFWIHLYSAEFMDNEKGFSRFFAYMNLFVGSMLLLVLADNMLLMYLGWEGVGLCSYLLIGFWYKDPENGYAARKAFIVTRVGDVALALGLFLLFVHMGTLQFPELNELIPVHWADGGRLADIAAILLLGGAVGKSAQLPLQTWLPDAMAGPSPVSALIHAATMVTAGVYLIARMHVLFSLSPMAMNIVAIVGTATLLLAGISALYQSDIKRVLAYSTISQIGYMFLALGVGAWSAAVFHFMMHAFFKALLFLGAGVLILKLHHEHNMFKMGGIWKQLPVTSWTFLFASGALAAVPLVTAGFYSKDQILWYAFAADHGNTWLWAGGLLGAFITALYTFRMIFVTFFGEAKMQVSGTPGFRIRTPLIVLGVLSLLGGFINLPHSFGHFAPLGEFLGGALPAVHAERATVSQEILFQIIGGITALAGIGLAWMLYMKGTAREARSGWRLFFKSGWKFDALYDVLFVQPVVVLSRINKADFIDGMYTFITRVIEFIHEELKFTQTGKLRWYLAGIGIGALLILSLMMWLI